MAKYYINRIANRSSFFYKREGNTMYVVRIEHWYADDPNWSEWGNYVESEFNEIEYIDYPDFVKLSEIGREKFKVFMKNEFYEEVLESPIKNEENTSKSRYIAKK